MKLVPLADRVVLKQLVAEETTKSGIVLPGQNKEKPQQAEVIAVGPGGVVDGKEIKMEVKVGDQVTEEKYATPMRMKRTVSVVKFWDGQLLNPIRKKEKSWFLTKTANYVSPLPTSILKSCTKTVGAAKTFAAIFLWMIRHISSAGISMPGILTLTPNCWNQEYCIIQVIVFLSDI